MKKRYLGVFLFALGFHLAFFWLFAGKAYTDREATDGGQYMVMAENMLAGRGFSLRTQEPYVPDTIRTPVYPALLAFSKALTGSFYPTIYLSIFLGATIPLAGMLILSRLKRSPRLELLAGLFLALDPHLWYYSFVYGSESIFLPLAAWGMVLLVLLFEQPTWKRGLAAGLVVGLGTLTRPIIQFLPFLVLVFVFYQLWTRKPQAKTLAKASFVFLLGWGLVLAPWFFRNHTLFGVWDYANVGWFNMYTRVAATAESIETGKPYDALRVEYLQRLHEKGYVATSPVEEQDVHGYEFKPIFQKETGEAIKRYPKGFVLSQISAFFTVVAQDQAILYAQSFGLLTFSYPSFSPTVVLLNEGPFALIRAFVQEFNLPFLYAAFARVFWMVLFFVSLSAPWFAWRYRREIVPVTLFLLLYELGIIALSLNAAAQASSRYRAQYIFVEVALALCAFTLWKYKTLREEGVKEAPLIQEVCPACGFGSALREAGSVRLYAIERCDVCGAHAVLPRPSPEAIKQVYGQAYFTGGGAFGYANYEEDKRATLDGLDAFLDILAKHEASSGRLLDIGAATGVFLERARLRGWDVVGQEISEEAAVLARAKSLPMVVGDMTNASHTPASFQAITMLDVIEHVPEPHTFLKQAATFLAPNGLVLLHTPDAGSAYARFMGLRWHAFVPPEHLTLFTSQSLRLLCERAGLRVIWTGRVPKAFRLSYILQTASRWLSLAFLARLARWVDRHTWWNVRLPLDLRDTMVVLAQKFP